MKTAPKQCKTGVTVASPVRDDQSVGAAEKRMICILTSNVNRSCCSVHTTAIQVRELDDTALPDDIRVGIVRFFKLHARSMRSNPILAVQTIRHREQFLSTSC